MNNLKFYFRKTDYLKCFILYYMLFVLQLEIVQNVLQRQVTIYIHVYIIFHCPHSPEC